MLFYIRCLPLAACGPNLGHGSQKHGQLIIFALAFLEWDENLFRSSKMASVPPFSLLQSRRTAISFFPIRLALC